VFSIYRTVENDRVRLGRREVLRVGGLTLLGLTSDELLRLRAHAQNVGGKGRRENSCVFIFLFGGPSHIDLWDMKPAAPSQVRGEFRPIATRVPSIQICEHLPDLARVTDRVCFLRSMTHHMPVHGPACSEMITGRPYFGPPITDQALPEDWPSLSSLTTRYANRRSALPPAVVLPWYLQFEGQERRIAGQTGGRMGERFNAFLVDGDPTRTDFRLPGIELPNDVPLERVLGRADFLRRLESTSAPPSMRRDLDELFSAKFRSALAMVTNPTTARAFDLRLEPESMRDRYGATKFGQSLLLARRLVEAGVSLVTVNWDDESRFDKVSPHWDTHHHLFAKLKEGLCPVFDRAFSTFIEDLFERGLLETTLVVATGEFGRTPKIGEFTQNAMTQQTGRDHWPHAFTVLLAGGSVRGGQVYGSTNATGGYVVDKPVTPADLAATILLHLGIDLQAEYQHVLAGTTHRITTGTPLRDLA
jgi:hypothetical protein